ncbi:hypothetical protein JCM33374_g2386 [Metschnikowia sp. JCM 33374]|nr:hypothetical protein JCM33374_g2386 [Metschnikowia sp. JCM 33374]
MDCFESDGFLRTWFAELPSDIIEHVCEYLPVDIIKETLLKDRKLRRVIIDHYYSKELRLILSPPKRPSIPSSQSYLPSSCLPHLCSLHSNSLEQTRQLVSITSYEEIREFLVENPDINPRSIKVTSSGDFGPMACLLQTFHSRLAQAPRLEIYVENHELTSADVQLIFSFPNLVKFHTSGVRLKWCFRALGALLEQSQSLRELSFLVHEICDWIHVNLPANLIHLDMSWPLYGNKKGVCPLGGRYYAVDEVFQQLKNHSSIKTLKITNTALDTINISHLPSTLEKIDLSNNAFRRFQCEGESASACWPKRLKSISLSMNNIDDSSMRQLSTMAWPPSLEALKLDCNGFTSFEHLTNLPYSLKLLDVSYTQIKTFYVHHNTDNYPFFKFPECLQTLNMAGYMDFTQGHRPHYLIPLDQRIHFPPNLECLDLSWHNTTRLACFVFPPSLTTLSLKGTQIHDLTQYDFTLGGKEIVNWKHLTNLHELDVSHNQIETLQFWCPPQLLRKLDLSSNSIKKLTGCSTPLLSEEYRDCTGNLECLDFGCNPIEVIEEDLVLPSELKTLNLKANRLTQFVFTEAFACHSKLTRLDLTFSYIERVVLGQRRKKYASRLQQFDLSRNSCKSFQMSMSEFYGVFEKIGLRVADRKSNLKSEHVFSAMQVAA